jgi:hypothetical protein
LTRILASSKLSPSPTRPRRKSWLQGRTTRVRCNTPGARRRWVPRQDPHDGTSSRMRHRRIGTHFFQDSSIPHLKWRSSRASLIVSWSGAAGHARRTAAQCSMTHVVLRSRAVDGQISRWLGEMVEGRRIDEGCRANLRRRRCANSLGGQLARGWKVATRERA